MAGAVAGIVLSVFMTTMSVAQNTDLWVGAKTAAAPFLGERALQPGFDGPAVLIGTLTHFAVSIGWGAVFGALAYGLSGGVTVAAGVFWGFVVWVTMYYVVLPLAGLPQIAASMPVGNAIFEHVLFGVSVGIAFLPFQPHEPGRLAPRIETARRPQRLTGTS